MRHRSLLLGILFVGACFKSGGSPPPAQPVAAVAAPAEVDYSATLADPVGFLALDSELVLSLDADQLRRSAMWPILEPRLAKAAGPDLATFTQVCGFDPVATIRGITIGVKNVKAETPDAIMVVTGLDRARLLDCMERARQGAATMVSIDGGIVVIKADPAKPDMVVFSFVDASTAVAMVGPTANPDALRGVLASGAPLRTSPMFAELLKQIDLAASLWTVMNGASSVFDDLKGMGVKPTAIFGSVQLATGLGLALKMRFATAQEAQSLAGMAQGQLGAAKAMFERLEVNAVASDVVVEAALTEAQLQSLLGLVGGMISAS